MREFFIITSLLLLLAIPGLASQRNQLGKGYEEIAQAVASRYLSQRQVSERDMLILLSKPRRLNQVIAGWRRDPATSELANRLMAFRKVMIERVLSKLGPRLSAEGVRLNAALALGSWASELSTADMDLILQAANGRTAVIRFNQLMDEEIRSVLLKESDDAFSGMVKGADFTVETFEIFASTFDDFGYSALAKAHDEALKIAVKDGSAAGAEYLRSRANEILLKNLEAQSYAAARTEYYPGASGQDFVRKYFNNTEKSRGWLFDLETGALKGESLVEQIPAKLLKEMGMTVDEVTGVFNFSSLANELVEWRQRQALGPREYAKGMTRAFDSIDDTFVKLLKDADRLQMKRVYSVCQMIKSMPRHQATQEQILKLLADHGFASVDDLYAQGESFLWRMVEYSNRKALNTTFSKVLESRSAAKAGDYVKAEYEKIKAYLLEHELLAGYRKLPKDDLLRLAKAIADGPKLTQYDEYMVALLELMAQASLSDQISARAFLIELIELARNQNRLGADKADEALRILRRGDDLPLELKEALENTISTLRRDLANLSSARALAGDVVDLQTLIREYIALRRNAQTITLTPELERVLQRILELNSEGDLLALGFKDSEIAAMQRIFALRRKGARPSIIGETLNKAPELHKTTLFKTYFFLASTIVVVNLVNHATDPNATTTETGWAIADGICQTIPSAGFLIEGVKTAGTATEGGDWKLLDLTEPAANAALEIIGIASPSVGVGLLAFYLGGKAILVENELENDRRFISSLYAASLPGFPVPGVRVKGNDTRSLDLTGVSVVKDEGNRQIRVSHSPAFTDLYTEARAEVELDLKDSNTTLRSQVRDFAKRHFWSNSKDLSYWAAAVKKVFPSLTDSDLDALETWKPGALAQLRQHMGKNEFRVGYHIVRRYLHTRDLLVEQALRHIIGRVNTMRNVSESHAEWKKELRQIERDLSMEDRIVPNAEREVNSVWEWVKVAATSNDTRIEQVGAIWQKYLKTYRKAVTLKKSIDKYFADHALPVPTTAEVLCLKGSMPVSEGLRSLLPQDILDAFIGEGTLSDDKRIDQAGRRMNEIEGEAGQGYRKAKGKPYDPHSSYDTKMFKRLFALWLEVYRAEQILVCDSTTIETAISLKADIVILKDKIAKLLKEVEDYYRSGAAQDKPSDKPADKPTDKDQSQDLQIMIDDALKNRDWKQLLKLKEKYRLPEQLQALNAALKRLAELRLKWLEECLSYTTRLKEVDKEAYRQLERVVTKALAQRLHKGTLEIPSKDKAEIARLEAEIEALRRKQADTPDSATDTIRRQKHLFEYTKEEREQYDKELAQKGRIESAIFWTTSTIPLKLKLEADIDTLLSRINAIRARYQDITLAQVICTEQAFKEHKKRQQELTDAIGNLTDNPARARFQEYMGINDFQGFFTMVDKLKEALRLPEPVPSFVIADRTYTSPCTTLAVTADDTKFEVTLAATRNPLHIGETADVTATVKGGKAPYTYTWRGDHAGSGERVTFASRKPGRHRLAVSVRDAQGATAIAEIEIGVHAVTAVLSGLGRRHFYGSTLTLSLSQITAIGIQNEPLDILWQASPSLKFKTINGKDLTNSVTFDRMGVVKLWAELRLKRGSVYQTVGETPQVEVEVVAPNFEIVFEPAQARVGEEVRATVKTTPEIPKELLSIVWFSPVTSQRQELSNGILFVPRDLNPVKLELAARVPVLGDTIQEPVKAEFTALPWTVKVEVLGPLGPPAKVWKPNVGLVDDPKTIYIHTNVRLKATIDPQPPFEVIYRWKLGEEDSHFAGQSTGSEITVNRSQAGQLTAICIAETKEGFKLGSGTASFSVSTPPKDSKPGGKADPSATAEMLAQAQLMLRKGQVDEAIALVEQAEKSGVKSPQTTQFLQKTLQERKIVLDAVIRTRALTDELRFIDASHQLVIAKNIFSLYKPVLEAEEHLRMTSSKYDAQIRDRFYKVEQKITEREYKQALDLAAQIRSDMKLQPAHNERLTALEREAQEKQKAKNSFRTQLKLGENLFKSNDLTGAERELVAGLRGGAIYFSAYDSEPTYYNNVLLEVKKHLGKVKELLTYLYNRRLELASLPLEDLRKCVRTCDDILVIDINNPEAKPLREAFASKLAEKYIDEGKRLRREKDYRGSIDVFTKAIELKPTATAHNGMGLTRYELKDYNAAIAEYEKALKLEPENSNSHAYRGDSKAALQDHRGALADYARAIQLNPNNANAYNRRGVYWFDQKDYKAALQDFLKAAALDPENQTYKNNVEIAKKKLEVIPPSQDKILKGRSSYDSTYPPNCKGDLFNGGTWTNAKNGSAWAQRDLDGLYDITEIRIETAGTDVTTANSSITLKILNEQGQWVVIDQLKDTNINWQQLSFGGVGRSIPGYRRTLAVRASAFRLELKGNGWFAAKNIELYGRPAATSPPKPPVPPVKPPEVKPPVKPPSGAQLLAIFENRSNENVHIFAEGDSFGPHNRLVPGEKREVRISAGAAGFIKFSAGRNGQVISTARWEYDPEVTSRYPKVVFDGSRLLVTTGLK